MENGWMDGFRKEFNKNWKSGADLQYDLVFQLAVSLGRLPITFIFPVLILLSSCPVTQVAIILCVLNYGAERTIAMYKMCDDGVAEIIKKIYIYILIRNSCFKRNNLHQTIELPAAYINYSHLHDIFQSGSEMR